MASERTPIGLKDVRALETGQTIWDSRVAGFGARRQKGTAIAYVLFYRSSDGRQRWHTIGRHGAPWTPETARAEAKRVLGEVVTGADPATEKAAARKAATVDDLCKLYWQAAESGRLMTRRRTAKKESTVATDKGRIERHIKPLLGSKTVAAVDRAEVERFMHAVAEGETAAKVKTGKKRGLANVRGGRGTATRTVGLLGSIFTFAVREGMRSDNPVHGVLRFADGRRERRLASEEYGQLGKAFEASADDVWPAAIAAAKFLLLTGWRLGEALGLRWSEIDIERRTATLPDTKTGRSIRPLSSHACSILPKRRKATDLVFPATRGDGVMSGFPSLWKKMAVIGGLPADITPHVLRHSYASLASDLGFSEPTIAALIGHKGQGITSRYVHAADAVLLAAADAIATEITARYSAVANAGN